MLKNDESSIAIGKRLAVLRVMAGLNRLSLSQQAGVSKTSISYWEHGKGNPMTIRSIGKIIQTFNKLGIKCDEEWLKTGNGQAPTSPNQATPAPLYNIESNINFQQLNFSQEINAFIASQQHSDKLPVIIEVQNNAMFPVFEKGDILGGVFLPSTSLNLSKEKNCIIKNGNILDIRRIRISSTPHHFNLSYFSYDPECTHPFEYQDVKLDLIAPVIRLWR